MSIEEQLIAQYRKANITISNEKQYILIENCSAEIHEEKIDDWRNLRYLEIVTDPRKEFVLVPFEVQAIYDNWNPLDVIIETNNLKVNLKAKFSFQIERYLNFNICMGGDLK